jgi:hypothetical protein
LDDVGGAEVSGNKMVVLVVALNVGKKTVE